MAWEIYTLGSQNAPGAQAAAAEIISRELGECAYSTNNLTYTYGGETYACSVTVANSSAWYNSFLFINKETGEFIISNANTTKASNCADNIWGAVLLVQVDANTAKLFPPSSTIQSMSSVFAINPDSTNNTTTLPLRQAFTGGSFPTEAKYRPIVGMYETFGYNIAPATCVQVEGQKFLCVAQRLFVKV